MIADFMENFGRFMSTVRFADIVDIAIVAFIVYQAFRLVRETRAEQLIKGILILIIMLQLSSWLGFNTMQYILENTMQLGFFALLIIFQPELRRGLERMGRGTAGRLLSFNNREEVVESTVEEVARAVDNLAKNKVGALICMERLTKLGDIIKTGTELNSKISAELLINIFVPNTPLHDGAVVIGSNKILAAACFLPLTHNNDLSKELGTRHRAAIGLSENSDAVVIVVSEETGKISIALDGGLTRNLTVESLKKALYKTLKSDTKIIDKDKFTFWKGASK
ncbi:MAG TPA: TIGR00159 family protein [Candidatus Aphodoplasma excrementigallinarum]|uniref:Diadenylate cyclase n=1 Tax=Candidatus Aphodoplasma excrementigallinarum TaxID=2840673 RepID=A0A9D1SZG7_9FIRM|nr:TIGR00159 family protein [Candidatus Aphodoplasma excrementigallinarum]